MTSLLFSLGIYAQSHVYSYIDETGRRIVTNIPFDHAPIDTSEPNPSEPVPKGKSQKKTVTSSPSTSRQGQAELAIRRAEEKARRSDQVASVADRQASQTDRFTQPEQLTQTVSPAVTNHSLLPVAPPLTAEAVSALPFSANTEYLDSIITKYADHHGVEPDLIRAVIKTESNFDPFAISPKGARGLMQLMPGTARRYGVRRIHDPEENIAGGVKYLKDLLEMFNGSVPLALSGYNAGENRVLRSGGIPNIPETRNYVSRISRMFSFDRSPFLTEPEYTLPQSPPIRRFINAQGMIEITNVEYGQ